MELRTSTTEQELEDMVKQEHFWGNYKGLRYEIHKSRKIGFRPDERNVPKDTFTWYLLLSEKNFTTEQWSQMWLEPIVDDKGLVHYNYMEATPFQEIPFHHGITYYDKNSNPDESATGHQQVKVGCDYDHYWDEGHSQSLRTIYFDVTCAIDFVHDYFSPVLWCWGCGAWEKPAKEDVDGLRFTTYCCRACRSKDK